MQRRFGVGRPVEQQWPHQNCASSHRDTRYRRALTPTVKLVIGQPAMEMRSRQNLQRPVFLSAVVNVQSHRYHLLEHVDGRVDMCDALFD